MLVLGSSSPHLLPDLIAYQLLIVQHSRKSEYPSRLRYDVDFRQWAAANNCHTWSQIHPQFYAFAAQGKAPLGWCPICYSDGSSHTYDCLRFSAPHTFPTHLPTPRTNFHPYPALLLPPPPAWQSPEKSGVPRPPPPKRPSPEHCILYNKYHGSCPYGDRCTKIHVCPLQEARPPSIQVSQQAYYIPVDTLALQVLSSALPIMASRHDFLCLWLMSILSLIPSPFYTHMDCHIIVM